MEPLITISIPVYNVAKYVEKALLSALNQTYENLEILIVDDKGTDNSMEIVKKIIETNARGKIVKIIEHEQNIGLGATRNTSIKNAKGEYIFFMDSDDYISDNCIELLYTAIKKSNADMAVGNFEYFSVNNNSRFPHKCSDNLFEGKDAYNKFFESRNYFVQTWNKLYRLNLLQNNNVYCIPSNTNEDIFFSFQLFYVIRKIVTISDITYYYTIGDNNATTSDMRKRIINEKRVCQFIGILIEMNSVYQKRGNINMARYLLNVKALLIRDICLSINTSRKEKMDLLNKIPFFTELESSDAIKLVSPRLCRYLGPSPIKAAMVENTLNIPVRVYRKIKRMFLS